MRFINYDTIVREAWQTYDIDRKIIKITDISANVSTNHVYSILLGDRNRIVAKLSYFGKYEHFVEDHSIINTLSNNLPSPYDNVLARSLMKGTSLFTYRFKTEPFSVWVVFYRPIDIKNKLPKRLSDKQVELFAVDMARFHKACHTVRKTLPESSKTMVTDIEDLVDTLNSTEGKYKYPMHHELIINQCNQFLKNFKSLQANGLPKIPVFVDWNNGNFSITDDFKLYSRWDYDWFRVSNRTADFYFFSRIVSDRGDQTIFTYDVDVLQQERFYHFLEVYHNIFPLTETEILFIKEAYRFFLLNYVVKYGRYFFHKFYAKKLQKEVLNTHLPELDEKFDPNPLIKAIKN